MHRRETSKAEKRLEGSQGANRVGDSWSPRMLGLGVGHCDQSFCPFIYNLHLFSIYFDVHHVMYGDRQEAGKRANKEINTNARCLS